jgi:hypothetical protein
MTPDRQPADQAVRDRVTTDFDTTFLLEAGAGTGKTTVLVNRVLKSGGRLRRCVAQHGNVAIVHIPFDPDPPRGRLEDDRVSGLASARELRATRTSPLGYLPQGAARLCSCASSCGVSEVLHEGCVG